MSMNDPLGDLIARIRNAQMRKKSKVSTPGSRLRVSVLEVLKNEGYIRGYAERRAQGRPQGARDRAEIFRRRAGDPRDLAGVEARPPRLCRGEEPAAHQQRPRRRDPLDAEGRDGRSRRARRQCRRRNPLHGVLGTESEEQVMSRIGKKAGRGPLRRHRQRRRPDRQGQGPEGRLAARAARRRRRPRWTAAQIKVDPRNETKRARSQWGTSRTLVANLIDRRHQGLRAASSRSAASAIARRCRARTCSSRSATATTWSIRSRKASRSRRRSRPRSSITGIDKQKVGQVAAEIRELPAAGALQGQGREVRRRVHLPQGRQEEVTEPARWPSSCDSGSTRREGDACAALSSAAPPARARLSVFRSSKHIYAQVIDDVKGVTVAAASSIEKDMRGSLKTGANVDAAKAVGKLVAERAIEKGVKRRGVRSRRLSLSRPRQGAGRRRARGRAEVLMNGRRTEGRRHGT